jgi:cholesterol transport system auxiliary component
MIRFAVLGAALVLGGCISFGPKAPKTLLTMTASAEVPVNAVRTTSAVNTVLILTPTAVAAVATTRIPVYDGASTLAYVADGAWNEAPTRALQRILSETVTARTTRIVLDPRQFGASPAMRLSGQLQRFGIDPVQMTAVIVFDAQLSRGADLIETRRFEARAPLAAITAPQAGAALNRAANDLSGQVADWLK